ncbi:MAG: thiamine ABC transporter ATP-binding protein [Pseudomonadota bacterium]
MLVLNEVVYRYNGHTDFRFDLNLDSEDTLAVIGPSGAGKTTLLNLISGFIMPNEGEVMLGKENITFIPSNQRPVNMLFQDNNLFFHLNAFDNVAVGINPGLKLNDTQKELVEKSLERVGLTGFNKRFPYQLSGGQKQRVAIARTLVRKKPILLLDEPFSFLDPPLKQEMLDLVRSLQEESSFIMIMVTHDFRDALRVCNKTCFLQDGKIQYIEKTEKFVKNSKIPLIKSFVS